VKGVVLQRVRLNISGVHVLVNSDREDILSLLELDFWSFVNSNKASDTFQYDLIVNYLSLITFEMPKDIKSSMQTQNALTYDVGNLRYCDYYSEVFTKIDFDKNVLEVNGENLEKVHEVIYLAILSRVGKILDLRGLHKLHAFSILFDKKIVFVCMMPSKGGKSTLLSELLIDSRVQMLSDDIPLVDSAGCVRPFPLKIGFNNLPEKLFINNKESNVYKMRRTHFGEKVIVSTRGISEKVILSGQFKKIILAEGFRFNSDSFSIFKSTWFQSFKGLFKHGVIGIGSPIIIEFFWESGFKDFIVKVLIFFRRLFAFYLLSLKATKITILCGKNPEKTAHGILKYLEEYNEL
jgi:hypothetical protein